AWRASPPSPWRRAPRRSTEPRWHRGASRRGTSRRAARALPWRRRQGPARSRRSRWTGSVSWKQSVDGGVGDAENESRPEPDGDSQRDERDPRDELPGHDVGDGAVAPAIRDKAEVDPALHRDEVERREHRAESGSGHQDEEERSRQRGRRRPGPEHGEHLPPEP